MNFNLSCKNDSIICQDVAPLMENALEYNISIEFLSSKNPAVAFFVIEPFLLFFD